MGKPEVLNQFEVDTTGICFMCLKDACDSRKLLSLLKISHYLHLDMEKVFSSETTSIPVQLLPTLQKSELRVTLCKGCSSEVDVFSTVLDELEMIQVKVGLCLKTIENTLLTAESDEKAKQDYWTKAVTHPQALMHVGIVEKLRKETIEKCSDRVQNVSLPKVSVQRLSTNDLNKLTKKPHSVPLLKNQDTKNHFQNKKKSEDNNKSKKVPLNSKSNNENSSRRTSNRNVRLRVMSSSSSSSESDTDSESDENSYRFPSDVSKEPTPVKEISVPPVTRTVDTAAKEKRRPTVTVSSTSHFTFSSSSSDSDDSSSDSDDSSKSNGNGKASAELLKDDPVKRLYPFKCSKCKKRFKTEDSLLSHDHDSPVEPRRGWFDLPEEEKRSMQGNKARQEITPQSNSKTAEGQSAATAKKSGNSSALKDTNRNKTLKRKSTNSGKKANSGNAGRVKCFYCKSIFQNETQLIIHVSCSHSELVVPKPELDLEQMDWKEFPDFVERNPPIVPESEDMSKAEFILPNCFGKETDGEIRNLINEVDATEHSILPGITNTSMLNNFEMEQSSGDDDVKVNTDSSINRVSEGDDQQQPPLKSPEPEGIGWTPVVYEKDSTDKVLSTSTVEMEGHRSIRSNEESDVTATAIQETNPNEYDLNETEVTTRTDASVRSSHESSSQITVDCA